MGRVTVLILGLGVLLTNERDGNGSKKTWRVERGRNGLCAFLIDNNASIERR